MELIPLLPLAKLSGFQQLKSETICDLTNKKAFLASKFGGNGTLTLTKLKIGSNINDWHYK